MSDIVDGYYLIQSKEDYELYIIQVWKSNSEYVKEQSKNGMFYTYCGSDEMFFFDKNFDNEYIMLKKINLKELL